MLVPPEASYYSNNSQWELCEPISVIKESTMYTERDAAYFAGFFDGEGSVSIEFSHSNKLGKQLYHLRLCVTNTDRSILEYLQERFGGSISAKASHTGWKQAYLLRTTSDCRDTWLNVLGEYCVMKTERIELAKIWRETKSEEARLQLKEYNKRGIEICHSEG